MAVSMPPPIARRLCAIRQRQFSELFEIPAKPALEAERRPHPHQDGVAHLAHFLANGTKDSSFGITRVGHIKTSSANLSPGVGGTLPLSEARLRLRGWRSETSSRSALNFGRRDLSREISVLSGYCCRPTETNPKTLSAQVCPRYLCNELCNSRICAGDSEKQTASRMALEAALLLVHPGRVELPTF